MSVKPAEATYIFKVPIVGDGAVGKTSLIVRFTEGTFTDVYKMTIGTSFAVKEILFENMSVKLQIWDLAGQPHFSGVRPLFYRGSTGVAYVFSVIDRESFQNITKWLQEVYKITGVLPGILVGNKADLVDQREVTVEEAQALAAQQGFIYVETSAKDNQNVGDAFRILSETIIKTRWPDWYTETPTPTPSVVTPSTPSTPAVNPTPAKPVSSTLGVTIADSSPTIDDSSPVTTQTPEPPLSVEPAPVPQSAGELMPEFQGTDIGALSKEEFERKVLSLFHRLEITENGVLGTYLRGLLLKDAREVILKTLRKIQNEQELDQF